MGYRYFKMVYSNCSERRLNVFESERVMTTFECEKCGATTENFEQDEPYYNGSGNLIQIFRCKKCGIEKHVDARYSGVVIPMSLSGIKVVDDETVEELNKLTVRLQDFMNETRGRLDKIERIISNYWRQGKK